MTVSETIQTRTKGIIAFVLAAVMRQINGVGAHGLRDHIKHEIEAFTRDEYSDNRVVAAGQRGGDLINVMLVIVIAAVIGYVGIKATSETENSIDVAANTEFDNASTSITTGFSSAMDLTEVVFIVLMLGVIIAVLVGLRGNR